MGLSETTQGRPLKRFCVDRYLAELGFRVARTLTP
jgi:hypothetical protein